MAEKTEFTVGRAHWGDKDVERDGKTVTVRHRYEKGEKRTVDPDTVTAEVQRGILIEAKGKAPAPAAGAGDKQGG